MFLALSLSFFFVVVGLLEGVKMQVNESASSALTRELILYASNRAQTLLSGEEMTDSAWLSFHIASVQSLKAQGVIVGLRLAERLLYREPAFGGSPLEIARFIGFTLWRAVFGRKVDSIKAIDSSYFLSDSGFCWLQGYPRVGASDEVNSLSIDQLCEKDWNLEDKGAADEYAGHREVLTYTVGIIEGAIEVLLSGGNVSVRGSFSSEGETRFILEFNGD